MPTPPWLKRLNPPLQSINKAQSFKEESEALEDEVEALEDEVEDLQLVTLALSDFALLNEGTTDITVSDSEFGIKMIASTNTTDDCDDVLDPLFKVYSVDLDTILGDGLTWNDDTDTLQVQCEIGGDTAPSDGAPGTTSATYLMVVGISDGGGGVFADRNVIMAGPAMYSGSYAPHDKKLQFARALGTFMGGSYLGQDTKGQCVHLSGFYGSTVGSVISGGGISSPSGESASSYHEFDATSAETTRNLEIGFARTGDAPAFVASDVILDVRIRIKRLRATG